MDKPAFSNRMSAKTASDRYFEKEAERKMRETGPSKAVDRLLAKYDSISSRKNYIIAIALYLRWLKENGATMLPDGFVKDNLLRMFKSDPAQVDVKHFQGA